MVAKIFAFAALALGAIAAPSAPASKPFKIGVTFGSETLYLTGTGPPTKNLAEGISCTISDKGSLRNSLTCENNLGYYFNEKHPLEGVLRAMTPEGALTEEKKQSFMGYGFAKSNQNWSIGPNNSIVWATSKPGKPVHFSKMGANNEEIYAEICSSFGHLDGAMFTQGNAKAYFV